MENSPWPICKIKKPWEVSPYPQLLLISKKLNVCRQVHYKTRHHQHSDIMFILMLNLSSFLFAAKNSVLQKYRRCQDKIL